MTEDTAAETFVSLSPANDGQAISACRGGETREWRAEAGAQQQLSDDAIAELIAFADDSPIVCFEAKRLAELLSRPDVLALARTALGKLRDLRELAFIWLPSEPEYALEALAGDAQERGHPAGDAGDDLAHTRAAYKRVLEAVQEAPLEFFSVIGPLLAADSSFAWLDWPAGSQDPIGILRLGELLPERPAPRKRDGAGETLPGDIRDLSEQFLSPGGAVEDAHPGYEHRAGQIEMTREVAEALREERFLLAEAGTGVGKSLAYLIPAILWARRSGEPVVVSTNTKNLQQQLMEKDIPLLQDALDIGFEAALLKGRGNYPCVRMLLSAAVDAANSLFRGEQLAAAHLLAWLTQSATGDLEEITPEALEAMPQLSRLIARVRSQGDACVGRACSHNDHCPVEIARAFARRADIVVSNHALTFADARTTVLPKYSRLIFDEAHNIESAATDGLALECSNYGFSFLVRAFTGEPGSFVAIMQRRLADMGDGEGMAEAKDALALIPRTAERFAEAVEGLGELVADFCFLACTDRVGEEGRASLRLSEAVRAMPEWAETVALGEAAHAAGVELLAAVEQFSVRLAELDKGGLPGAEGLDADADGMRSRVADSLAALVSVLSATGENTEFVTWAETWRGPRGQAWSLHAAPVDIGPVLDEAIYQHKSAIIFTSATITVEGEFSYFRQRLGLDEHQENLTELMAASPFDFAEQLLLCIPKDMPEPNDRAFPDAVIDALRRICEVTEGGTLALFTAKARMRRAFERLEGDLRKMQLTPLCQDVSGPRWALLERLRHDPRAVLFGVKSFWEGVDVPGDALRCVVICKLPFAVPSDPIIEARQEDVARKGLNPMQDYYIPEAIVGFKQGFGRLIRSTTDTGVVFVLDRRILTKPYGRRFFRSIERCELSRDTLEECVSQARGWLGR